MRLCNYNPGSYEGDEVDREPGRFPFVVSFSFPKRSLSLNRIRLHR
jgi:hypothetical protein